MPYIVPNTNLYNGITNFSTIDDLAGRKVQNTLFGEMLTTIRNPLLIYKFDYGVSEYEFTLTQTNSGTVTESNSQAILQSSTNVFGLASVQSKKYCRYIPGCEVILYFTAEFTTGAEDSIQKIGLYDKNNGYWIGYNGTDFCVSRRKNSTDNIINQSDFNIDTLDGRGKSGLLLDKTKNNIYRISYSYLGSGNITFEVLNSDILSWVPFHTIKWANYNNGVHVLQPSLPVKAEVQNLGNNTNIILKTGSINASLAGVNLLDSPSNRSGSIDVTKTISANVLTNIVSIKVATSFNSKNNNISVIGNYFSVASDGNKIVKIETYANPTIPSASYQYYNTANSVVEYDSTSLYVSGGTFSLGLALGKSDSKYIEVKNLKRYLYPGNVITIAAFSTNDSDITVAFGWDELF